MIPSGIILTNNIALFDLFVGGKGFTLTGGGTLFQNSTATNQINFNAALTIAQGTYRITDISTNGRGNLGRGNFTLDGGTLSYGGDTASTTHAIAINGSNGSIQVEKLSTALTINAEITGLGGLTKNGIGTLVLPVANGYNGGTILSNGTLLVTNTTGSATGGGNVNLLGGTLGGPGIIAGTVIAGAAPHTIAPSATLVGNTATTLTVAGLTTNLFTTLAYNLKTPGSVNDVIAVTAGSALSLNGGTLQINNTSTGAASLGYYKAIQYLGSIQGAGISSIELPAIANNISYVLDTAHDPGFIDIHRGFLGDASDDGSVNFTDFLLLSANFGQSNKGWNGGDFNNDNSTNFNDFLTLSAHFGQTIGGSTIAAAPDELAALQSFAVANNPIPEPASLALLMLAVPALGRRRR